MFSRRRFLQLATSLIVTPFIGFQSQQKTRAQRFTEIADLIGSRNGNLILSGISGRLCSDGRYKTEYEFAVVKVPELYPRACVAFENLPRHI